MSQQSERNSASNLSSLRLNSAIEAPSHYTQYGIQTIEVIEDWNLHPHLSNVIKYICRAPYKGTQQKDLYKSLWYLIRYILRIFHGFTHKEAEHITRKIFEIIDTQTDDQKNQEE